MKTKSKTEADHYFEELARLFSFSDSADHSDENEEEREMVTVLEETDAYAQYREQCVRTIETRGISGFERYDIGRLTDQIIHGLFRLTPETSVKGGIMTQKLLAIEDQIHESWTQMQAKKEECLRSGKDFELNRTPFDEFFKKKAEEFRQMSVQMKDYFKSILTVDSMRKDDTVDTFCILTGMRNTKADLCLGGFYDEYPQYADLYVREVLLDQLLYLCEYGSINAPFVIAMACFEGMTVTVEHDGVTYRFDDPKEYVDMAAERGNPLSAKYYEVMMKAQKKPFRTHELMEAHKEDAFIYAGLARQAAIIWEKRLEYDEALRCADLYDKIANDLVTKDILYRVERKNEAIKLIAKTVFKIIVCAICAFLIIKAVLFLIELAKVIVPWIVVLLVLAVIGGGGGSWCWWWFWTGDR